MLKLLHYLALECHNGKNFNQPWKYVQGAEDYNNLARHGLYPLIAPNDTHTKKKLELYNSYCTSTSFLNLITILFFQILVFQSMYLLNDVE